MFSHEGPAIELLLFVLVWLAYCSSLGLFIINTNVKMGKALKNNKIVARVAQPKVLLAISIRASRFRLAFNDYSSTEQIQR